MPSKKHAWFAQHQTPSFFPDNGLKLNFKLDIISNASYTKETNLLVLLWTLALLCQWPHRLCTHSSKESALGSRLLIDLKICLDIENLWGPNLWSTPYDEFSFLSFEEDCLVSKKFTTNFQMFFEKEMVHWMFLRALKDHICQHLFHTLVIGPTYDWIFCSAPSGWKDHLMWTTSMDGISCTYPKEEDDEDNDKEMDMYLSLKRDWNK